MDDQEDGDLENNADLSDGVDPNDEDEDDDGDPSEDDERDFANGPVVDVGSSAEPVATGSTGAVPVSYPGSDSHFRQGRAGAGPMPTLPARRSTSGMAHVSALDRFLQQIGRYPLLTPDEERELTMAVYDRSDPIAARKLVVHNLRLVVKMAYRYRRVWANVLDLIQEGNVGLVEAVGRYDPFKGAKFSTYAAYWIRAYLLRYLLDQSRMVRISRTRAGRKLFFRLSKERERLRNMGIEPSPKLLAERLGVSQEDYEEVVRHMDQPEIRLDAPLYADGEGTDTMLDTLSAPGVSPEAAAHRNEFTADVAAALESFAETLADAREQAAWTEHLMAEDPVSLSELGERFGVTKQRMGQIVMALRKRLKTHLVQELGPDVQLGYNLDSEV